MSSRLSLLLAATAIAFATIASAIPIVPMPDGHADIAPYNGTSKFPADGVKRFTLYPGEVEKITSAEGYKVGESTFVADVKNGNDKIVLMSVTVTFWRANGLKGEEYKAKCHIGPGADGTITFKAKPSDFEEGASWTISRATGYKFIEDKSEPKENEDGQAK